MPLSRLVNSAAGAQYYRQPRDELLTHLPQPLGRVLDVGCGAGATARAARTRGATSIDGIEIVEAQALQARQHMDTVHVGAVEDVLPTLTGPFDTILCLDVLEHLADPYRVLACLRAITRTGGHLQVSVPNARHKNLAVDLAIHGTFNYRDSGHRDWTHLRWFTRSDLQSALYAAGWHTVRSDNSDPGPRGRWLGRVFGPRVYEFFATQIYMTAMATHDTSATHGPSGYFPGSSAGQQRVKPTARATRGG